jgi:hypothetical protein
MSIAIQWARRLPGMLERAIVQLRQRREPRSVATNAGRQEAARIEVLEKRFDQLEAMVEGLQDAVYRESVRQGREIDQLQQKAEPAEMRRALGQDAREHGI